MNVSDAIARRRSVRAYLDQPVDVAVVRDIVERAARAASGGNLQPWHVDIVHGDTLAGIKATLRDRMAKGIPPETSEYPVYPAGLTAPWEDRRRAVGEAMFSAIGIPREDKAKRLQWFSRNFQFFDAPVALFVSLDRQMGLPQWSDAGALLNSIMLLLVEAGLDSCPQECWAMYPQLLGGVLGLPENRILWTGLSIGHRDPDHPANAAWQSARAPADEWLTMHG
jgi:nitroreductase